MKTPEIARLRNTLKEYACPDDCWANGTSGDNPLVGKPNEAFCHNSERGRECGITARKALEQTA